MIWWIYCQALVQISVPLEPAPNASPKPKQIKNRKGQLGLVLTLKSFGQTWSQKSLRKIFGLGLTLSSHGPLAQNTPFGDRPQTTIHLSQRCEDLFRNQVGNFYSVLRSFCCKDKDAALQVILSVCPSVTQVENNFIPSLYMVPPRCPKVSS